MKRYSPCILGAPGRDRAYCSLTKQEGVCWALEGEAVWCQGGGLEPKGFLQGEPSGPCLVENRREKIENEAGGEEVGNLLEQHGGEEGFVGIGMYFFLMSQEEGWGLWNANPLCHGGAVEKAAIKVIHLHLRPPGRYLFP